MTRESTSRDCGPRIAAFAYACDPARGSEQGAGWCWARILARIGPTCVYTRTEYRDSVLEALPSTEERENLDFVFLDLPRWASFWQKGHRGDRSYYMLWQLAALRHARRRHVRQPFDLAWHLTYANVWMGSVATLVGPPSVFGPAGGGVTFPWNLASTVGAKGLLFEVARATGRNLGRYANPLSRVSWNTASLILAQNEDVIGWLPAKHREKTVLFPNAVVQLPEPPLSEPEYPERVALYAGRLIPLKGVILAIEAVARLRDWRLVICGSGYDESRLRAAVRELGLTDRVEFLGAIPREDLLRMMQQRATTFLFPSLHDEAGWVVAEATTLGLPVVCLDKGGSRTISGDAGIVVPSGGQRSDVVAGLARALEESAAHRHTLRPTERYALDTVARRVEDVLRERALLPSSP